MSKFKVGDRVAVYRGDFNEFFQRRIYTVTAIEKNGLLQISNCPNKFEYAHPKQCRRLKPRKRREWWISVHKPGCRYLYSIHSTREEAERTLCSRCNTEAVLVREARSGEVKK